MTTLVDRRAALIVVDLERGVIPYVDASTASSIVANAARLAAAFRDSGRLVVLTVQHPGGRPDDATYLKPPRQPRPTSPTSSPSCTADRPTFW